MCQSSAPNSVCGASYINLTKNQNLYNSKQRSGVGERLRLQFPACHVAIEQRLHFTLIIFFRLQDSEALKTFMFPFHKYILQFLHEGCFFRSHYARIASLNGKQIQSKDTVLNTNIFLNFDNISCLKLWTTTSILWMIWIIIIIIILLTKILLPHVIFLSYEPIFLILSIS